MQKCISRRQCLRSKKPDSGESSQWKCRHRVDTGLCKILRAVRSHLRIRRPKRRCTRVHQVCKTKSKLDNGDMIARRRAIPFSSVERFWPERLARVIALAITWLGLPRQAFQIWVGQDTNLTILSRAPCVGRKTKIRKRLSWFLTNLRISVENTRN